MSKLGYEIKGLFLALLLSVLLASLAGLSIYYTSLAETLTGSLGNVILVLSIFAGSGYVSFKRGNKGLMRGVSFGLVFFALMLAASFLFAQPAGMLQAVRTLAITVTAGVLGGVLGVSLSA